VDAGEALERDELFGLKLKSGTFPGWFFGFLWRCFLDITVRGILHNRKRKFHTTTV
jgi:hypothetical protein